jgi:hypothetical protein
MRPNKPQTGFAHRLPPFLQTPVTGDNFVAVPCCHGQTLFITVTWACPRPGWSGLAQFFYNIMPRLNGPVLIPLPGLLTPTTVPRERGIRFQRPWRWRPPGSSTSTRPLPGALAESTASKSSNRSARAPTGNHLSNQPYSIW